MAAKRKAEPLPSNQTTISSFFKKAAAPSSPSSFASPAKISKESPPSASSAASSFASYAQKIEKLAPLVETKATKAAFPSSVSRAPVIPSSSNSDEPPGAQAPEEDMGAADALSSDLGDVPTAPPPRTSSLASEELDETRDWTAEELADLKKHYNDYAGLDACYAILASLLPGRSARRIAHKLFELDLITYRQLRGASFTVQDEAEAEGEAQADVAVPTSTNDAELPPRAKALLEESAAVRGAVPWLCAHLHAARSSSRTEAYVFEPRTSEDFSFLGDSQVQALLDELPLSTVLRRGLSFWAVPPSLSSASIARLSAALKRIHRSPSSTSSTPRPARPKPPPRSSSPPAQDLLRAARQAAAALDDFQLEEQVEEPPAPEQ